MKKCVIDVDDEPEDVLLLPEKKLKPTKKVFYMDDIHEIKMSKSCLQSMPCQHGIIIIPKYNKREFISIEPMRGGDILRMIVASKAKINSKAHHHFKYLITQEKGWGTLVAEDHRNKKDIETNEIIFKYPKKYEHKPLYVTRDSPAPKKQPIIRTTADFEKALIESLKNPYY